MSSNITMEHRPIVQSLKELCKRHMADNGLACPDHIIASQGRLYRYSADNNKNKADEWYVAYEGVSKSGKPYLRCIYGSWSTGEKHEFKSWDEDNIFDPEEHKVIAASLKAFNAEIEKELHIRHEKASQEAARIWQLGNIKPPSEEYLRYLEAKGIKPIGVKFCFDPSNHPSLVIPLYDVNSKIHSLQFIAMDIEGKSYKRFLSGGKKKGNFFALHNIVDGQSITVTEGYATGVSVYMAAQAANLEGSVVIAFDSGNLFDVIENLKRKYPNSSITIAVDNDKTGKTKAYKAAEVFHCKIVLPTFPIEKSCDPNGKAYTDFNDIHQVFGLEEVARQLMIPHALPVPEKLPEAFMADLLKKEDPCADFSLANLPAPLATYISSLCNTTNAHPIMITSSVLATISAFLGTCISISEKYYFQKLYPNLWILNITKSGQFKTTALNKGARLAREYAKSITSHIRELKIELRTADEKRKKVLEEEIQQVSLKNIVLPDKITPEAFLEHLGQGYRGVILISEFGAWLQNLNKNHNSDLMGILTDLYDVPQSYRYKTRTQGDHILNEPCFSICAVSTLTWVKAYLKPTDVPGGFFPRFLIFAPPHQDEVPPALPTQKIMVDQDAELVVKKVLEGMSESREYTLSGSAEVLFAELHLAIYSMTKLYNEELLDPYVKRWSPYLLKIAMIMQLFIDTKSKEISNAALIAAKEFLFPAIRSTAQLIGGELSESEQQYKCRMLFEWICQKVQATGLPIKKKTFLQSKKLKGGHKEYDHILQSLIESGRIECTEAPKKMDYEYIPVVDRLKEG